MSFIAPNTEPDEQSSSSSSSSSDAASRKSRTTMFLNNPSYDSNLLMDKVVNGDLETLSDPSVLRKMAQQFK